MLKLLLPLYRKLPPFRGKYRLGYALFKSLLEKKEPEEVKVNKDLLFYLPNSLENIGKEIMVKGEYEKKSVQAIISQLKSIVEPVFFDVGANIGAIGIPVKKALPATQMYAFEASPATFQYLKKNYAINGIETDRLYNKAVHSSDGGQLDFFDAVEYGKSSLAPMYAGEEIKVGTISLDAFTQQQNIKQIDLLKVDVQGFEVEVFKGMERLLLDCKAHLIYFEFEGWAEEAAGYKIGESQDYLLSVGYDLFSRDGKKLSQPLRVGRSMLWAKPGKKERTKD